MSYTFGNITSVELAKLCSVSQGTVDRALNDRPGISPKTKERILKVAEEYGYLKDMRASSLVLGKTKLIGLVIFNLQNEFFSELATAVETTAREKGYTTMIALSNTNKELERQCIERMFSFGADGVILCPVGYGEEYSELLMRYRKPIVTVANKACESLAHIGANEADVMVQMTLDAVKKGYTNISLYAPPLRFLGEVNIYAQKMRSQGYVQAMAENGLGEKIFTNEVQMLDYLQNRGGGKTAVLCTSDLYALRLIKKCGQIGIQIPNDVGISGFDNIKTLDLFDKRLTTVSYPIVGIGTAGALELIDQIDGEKPSNRFLTCDLAPGETL